MSVGNVPNKECGAMSQSEPNTSIPDNMSSNHQALSPWKNSGNKDT